jgi:predicted nucleic acid-binding protein
VKVLLDTNIILDVLQERKPFVDGALRVLELGLAGSVSCFFTANAVTDVFYIYSRIHGKKAAKKVLAFLLDTVDVVSVDKADCLSALALPNDDLEDALVEVCAEKVSADFIISRDGELAASAAKVGIISPDDFIAMMT